MFSRAAELFRAGSVVGGRYELRKELGRGGMGVVWSAWDKELEMEVALKVLPEVILADPLAVKRIREEAKLCLELTHPGIVRVYTFEEWEGVPFIVMEKVGEGRTLAHELADRGKFPVEEALEVMGPICEALEYAHGRGFIHRDIKPLNILFDEGGRAKLGDFGIARRVKEGVSRVSMGVMVGTPLYMAPEQLAGREVGPWTDVYALGCVVYEMLAGRPPWSLEGDVLYQIERVEAEEIAEVSEGVNQVLKKAMAKRVEVRYGSVREFYEDFERAVRGRGGLSGEVVIGREEERKEGSLLVEGVRVPELTGEEKARFEKKYREADLKEALRKATESGKGRDFLWLLERAELSQGEKNELLHLAAERGEALLVYLLLREGADEDARDGDGRTPLHKAAEEGHVEVAKVLLKHGADLNAKDRYEDTPLHKAAEKGRVEVVKLLLEHGADVNTRDRYENTPLDKAAENGHVEVVKVLLEHGADVNAWSSSGWTPLHSAARRGHVEVVKVLLEHGADVNAKDELGNIPLHMAALEGHIEVVKVLLKHGADVNAKNRDGKTPLDLAKDREVEQVLKKYGAEATSFWKRIFG